MNVGKNIPQPPPTCLLYNTVYYHSHTSMNTTLSLPVTFNCLQLKCISVNQHFTKTKMLLYKQCLLLLIPNQVAQFSKPPQRSS